MEQHFIIIVVATFIIYAVLLFRVAQKCKHHSPFLAFLPILNLVQFLEMGQRKAWWVAVTLIPPLVIDVILFFILSDYPFGILLVLFGVPLIGLLILLFQIIQAGIYIAAKSGRAKTHGILIGIPYLGIPSLFLLGSKNMPPKLKKAPRPEADEILEHDDRETIESLRQGLALGIPEEEIKKVALENGVKAEKFDLLYEEAKKPLLKTQTKT